MPRSHSNSNSGLAPSFLHRYREGEKERVRSPEAVTHLMHGAAGDGARALSTLHSQLRFDNHASASSSGLFRLERSQLSAHSAAQRGALASVTEGDEGVSPNGQGFLLSIHEVRALACQMKYDRICS